MTTKGKKVQKAVVYKRAKFHTEIKGQTLKTLLEAAMLKRQKLGERRQNVASTEDPIYHAIGSTKCENPGFVFGALMTYTPDTDPLCIIDDAEAVDVVMETVSAPATDDGKRREFLASLMFFAVIGNHVVLMQSQALKSPHLERYLQWYLHSSEVLAGTNTLALIDTPSETVRKKMDQAKGVRSIKLGGELVPPSVVVPSSTAVAVASAVV